MNMALRRPGEALKTATKGNTMNSFEVVMIAEGVIEAPEEEQIEAWQNLIDSGLCWQLQGSFGRTAAVLIKQGICQRRREAEAEGGLQA